MSTHPETAHQDPALHRLFLASMDSEPVAPPVHQQLVASRRGLARRRRKFVVVSAAALTLLALMPAVAGYVGGEKPSPQRQGEMSEEAMISTCRDGKQPAIATEALFQSGTPEVKVHGTAGEMMRVVLVSADGEYWAECFINLYEGAENMAGMAVYSTTPGNPNTAGGYTHGYTCIDLDGPPYPPCSTFMVLYVSRVTEPVAAVEFDTIDGHTTTVEPVDGFVLFAYTGDVPDGYPLSAETMEQMPQWLERVTYLAADGTRLAANNMGTGRADEFRVEGLPSTRAYTEGFGEKVEDPEDACAPWRERDMTPLGCLTAADLAAMSPEERRIVERQLVGGPGETSIMVEGPVTEEHAMLRRCRGLPPLNEVPAGANNPKVDPLICNALELMASGEIPTGHHYDEAELQELAR